MVHRANLYTKSAIGWLRLFSGDIFIELLSTLGYTRQTIWIVEKGCLHSSFAKMLDNVKDH